MKIEFERNKIKGVPKWRNMVLTYQLCQTQVFCQVCTVRCYVFLPLREMYNVSKNKTILFIRYKTGRVENKVLYSYFCSFPISGLVLVKGSIKKRLGKFQFVKDPNNSIRIVFFFFFPFFSFQLGFI